MIQMSTTQKTDYPFHTDTIDGQSMCGVMFVAGSGQFYEFQNPENHNDYERMKDPRTRDVLTHDGPTDRALKTVMGGRVCAVVPAEEWADFRETYVNADSDRLDDVQAQFKERHAEWLDQR